MKKKLKKKDIKQQKEELNTKNQDLHSIGPQQTESQDKTDEPKEQNTIEENEDGDESSENKSGELKQGNKTDDFSPVKSQEAINQNPSIENPLMPSEILKENHESTEKTETKAASEQDEEDVDFFEDEPENGKEVLKNNLIDPQAVEQQEPEKKEDLKPTVISNPLFTGDGSVEENPKPVMPKPVENDKPNSSLFGDDTTEEKPKIASIPKPKPSLFDSDEEGDTLFSASKQRPKIVKKGLFDE